MFVLKKFTFAVMLAVLFAACSGNDSQTTGDADFTLTDNEGDRSATVSGELTTDDDELSDFYFDVIELGFIESDQVLVATVTPNDFDAHVFLVYSDFDTEEDGTEEIIAVFSSEGVGDTEEVYYDFSEIGDGNYSLYVTTGTANEVGAYEAEISIIAAEDFFDDE